MRFFVLCLMLLSCKQKPLLPSKESLAYWNARADLFRKLPNDSAEVLFVGTSLTEGFPLQDFFHDTLLKNRGVSGSRSVEILKRIDEAKGAAKVFIEAGANDFKYSISPDSIVKNIAAMVSALPGSKVYVQAVLPEYMGYEKNNPLIHQTNQKLKAWCAANSITFIPLWDAFLNKPELRYDGLHLNYEGYRLWTEMLRPYL